eukprot:scaffold142732_cov36-Tisochrysis_lutea.AAC.1
MLQEQVAKSRQQRYEASPGCRLYGSKGTVVLQQLGGSLVERQWEIGFQRVDEGEFHMNGMRSSPSIAFGAESEQKVA